MIRNARVCPTSYRCASDAARSQFGLSELGYRCMAEHVALTIDLSVPQPAPLEIGPAK